jgi:hypothetical protein
MNKILPIILVVVLSGCATATKMEEIIYTDDSRQAIRFFYWYHDDFTKTVGEMCKDYGGFKVMKYYPRLHGFAADVVCNDPLWKPKLNNE